VDTIQALLGNLLLVLAGLALVLLAVILLLVQANTIVRLASKLTRRLRSDDSDGTEPHLPIHDRPHARSASSEGGD
jgi:Na+-transporting methylmalonyl-CoA/oxaloacetate decarboxylase gamma subunit